MNLRPLRPDQQQKPVARWNYHQNSKDFIGWVNKLGIEKTWIGRLADFLNSKLHLQKIGLLFLFSLILSFLVSWDFERNFSGFKEGQWIAEDVKSPQRFDVVDQEETARRKEEAALSIPPVYDFDPSFFDNRAMAVRRAIDHMRVKFPEFQKSNDLVSAQNFFEADLGSSISRDSFSWIVKQRFNPALESVIAQNLERFNDLKIVDDTSAFKQANQARVIVNVLAHGYRSQEFVQDSRSLVDANEIRRDVSNQVAYPGFKRRSDIGEINDILKDLIEPNLTLNKQETELRRTRAAEFVQPYMVQIRKNQVVAHGGSYLQRSQVETLDQLSRLQSVRHKDFVSVVAAIFFVILLFCYLGYVSRFMTKVLITPKDAVAMGSILITQVLMMKLVLFVANTALAEKFTSIPPSFYLYLMPVSFGAMMVSLLIPFGEVVWLFAVFFSVIAGLLAEHSFGYMILAFTSSIVAARGVYGCKKRDDLYWAGIKTGLVNVGLVVCLTLMNKPTSELLHSELWWNIAAAFLSGMFACFVTLVLIPLWETVFIYTTDIKLLELSNLNHPLLKELIVKAPGTYHHSLVVGSMCEAAAEAIGANPLLAKVCAYYHDIGKTDHAQYFIENQRPGENRHDHISPGMSKTILIAHVKDGVEKALKFKLGKSIIDVIEQHHGTTLISFFFHRAKQCEDITMHEVTEDEYRYPGPQPEFREAALCMLADSIEAAARTLDEPTPARLQTIVHTIVQKKFLDRQLDSCNLTLKELNVIEDAFSKILLGIYHQRIDYPTTPPKATSPKANTSPSVS